MRRRAAARSASSTDGLLDYGSLMRVADSGLADGALAARQAQVGLVDRGQAQARVEQAGAVSGGPERVERRDDRVVQVDQVVDELGHLVALVEDVRRAEHQTDPDLRGG